MNQVDSLLREGRAAYEAGDWRRAFDALASVRDQRSLEPEDLWRLAQAAYLLGREDAFLSALQSAHQLCIDAEQPIAAARHAFWIGFHLANRGEPATAGGWFARAARLLDEADRDCAERGYLLLPDAHRQLMAGRTAEAAAAAARAVTIARRFRDDDLLALALHLHGRALLRERRLDEGLALLDEAMVAVTCDELSPPVTGLVYCSVIAACREVHALGRAHEWTSALRDWCDAQPEMLPYTGECRVYRAEVLRLHGEWREALEEARSATSRFAAGSEPSAEGFAAYQQAELHRLRGEFAAAEDAYREAASHGQRVQPGLALLRLVQGDAEAASTGIRRALAETVPPLARAPLLAAAAAVFADAGATDDARRAADELTRIAADWASPFLDTTATQQRGLLMLADGAAADALPLLARALDGWRELDAPYEAARVRELIGRARRALDDREGAALELDAARAEYTRLGARPDLRRVESGAHGARRDAHDLTPRQREVLALLATGLTNRAIAERLFISEKTVARHLADIYRTLGVSSRAAATAYAYQHDLLDGTA